MAGIHVDVDTFVRAETDRMLAGLQARAGGVNRFGHHRAPASVDTQPVIRMNRDTLYSMAVVDLAAGATLTLPKSGRRYVSVMIVNQDHDVHRVSTGGHLPADHGRVRPALRGGPRAHLGRPRRRS